VLHEGFDTIKECEGALLFQNSLMQLYRQNLWVAEHVGTPELAARLEHLGEPRGAGKEVRIEVNGSVRNSFLGAGSVVDGLVEGSVIFPDVVIAKGAVVYNSVVMSGNRIAPRAQVLKTLALPYTGETQKNSYNIGEGCSVGQKHSAASNFDHSSQIREGLTVLGANAEIPRGLTVSAGCFIGAGVGAQQLKGIKEVRKGTSVLWNTDQ
jgi:NDP-sugar pyrophosphorylase family protein